MEPSEHPETLPMWGLSESRCNWRRLTVPAFAVTFERRILNTSN